MVVSATVTRFMNLVVVEDFVVRYASTLNMQP